MAGVSRKEEETKISQHVYFTLQGVSCPLVEHLYLREADSMLQLLCTPSQLRTDILMWICSRIKPEFATWSELAVTGSDPDAVTREMALVGQELMLCRASDLSLIKGEAKPLRQLQFLQQLLTVVQDWEKQGKMDVDLVEELFKSQNLPLLTRMLQPELPFWPADIQKICDEIKSCELHAGAEATEVEATLQSARSELERLQSQCDFLSEAAQAAALSPSSLRVAACDLQQLMATFRHVYEADLKDHCGRAPPSFSTDCHVFQRVQQLLLACNTELEMLKEASEASACVTEEVKQLQTKPEYWSGGEKHTLPEQLEELRTRISDYTSLLQS
ncbi:unnamed protein product [Ophioblennius macclurei]